jgi:hypothetical protein
MCYTGVILNPEKARIPWAVAYNIISHLYTNSHGFYLYSASPDYYVRTLDLVFYKQLLLKVLNEGPRNAHLHFRLATSGLVDVNNVHGWKVGNYYVTHNGIVTSYLAQKNNNLSDTLWLIKQDKFSNYLLNEEWGKLYDYLLEKGFYGIMLLVKRGFKKVVAISVMKPIKYYKIDGVTYVLNEPLRQLDILKPDVDSFESQYLRDGVYLITESEAKTLYKHKKTTFSMRLWPMDFTYYDYVCMYERFYDY